MKKWDVLINAEGFYNGEYTDIAEEYFEAETEEEAIEVAKSWICEQGFVDDSDIVESWAFIANEVDFRRDSLQDNV